MTTTTGSRSVAQKMGVKAGARAHLVNAPETALAAIDLPEMDIGESLTGEFDYLHMFCVTQAEMDDTFPTLKAHMSQTGMLWLSWPTGRKLGSDLTLPRVIEIGYDHGLVESTCLRVDDTWSGLKFTHPKPGKIYQNSYGTLPNT